MHTNYSDVFQSPLQQVFRKVRLLTNVFRYFNVYLCSLNKLEGEGQKMNKASLLMEMSSSNTLQVSNEHIHGLSESVLDDTTKESAWKLVV